METLVPPDVGNATNYAPLRVKNKPKIGEQLQGLEGSELKEDLSED